MSGLRLFFLKMKRPINKLAQGLATSVLGGFAVALSSDGSCANSQIQVFAPLSTISAAQAYCSSAYPQTVTTTLTVPVTSDTTSLVTVTTPSSTTEVDVVSVTETETTMTTTPVTTTSTVTVTVTTSSVAKRTIGCRKKSKTSSGYSASDFETYSLSATTSAVPTSSASSTPSSSSSVDLFSSLVSADPSIQSIACSCIETAAVVTATETATVTNEVAATSTVADVQTVHVTSVTTITETATETATSTLTATTTTTTYVAEPTSCADVGAGATYTAANGESFTTNCGRYYSGSNTAIVISSAHGYTYTGCLEACSTNSACIAINFGDDSGYCVLLKALGTLASIDGLSSGVKQ
ncbi:hypothetical protein KJ359_006510 [Pestalotiopsis sp. 9143b]|nr:hypothetical protein KJ359_006510 [Pestalotiopsis sp. 9143b]